jgi:hypothetical protein
VQSEEEQLARALATQWQKKALAKIGKIDAALDEWFEGIRRGDYVGGNIKALDVLHGLASVDSRTRGAFLRCFSTRKRQGRDKTRTDEQLLLRRVRETRMRLGKVSYAKVMKAIAREELPGAGTKKVNSRTKSLQNRLSAVRSKHKKLSR